MACIWKTKQNRKDNQILTNELFTLAHLFKCSRLKHAEFSKA